MPTRHRCPQDVEEENLETLLLGESYGIRSMLTTDRIHTLGGKMLAPKADTVKDVQLVLLVQLSEILHPKIHHTRPVEFEVFGGPPNLHRSSLAYFLSSIWPSRTESAIMASRRALMCLVQRSSTKTSNPHVWAS